MATAVKAVLHLYRLLLAPLLPPNTCRFHPTCSQYMIDAVDRYGAIRGVWRGVLRILRCHPLHPGGFDPA